MDPISNFLINLKNASLVRKPSCLCPASKATFKIAQILKQEGFISDVKKESRGNNKAILRIKLRYFDNGQLAISEVKRLSRLGRRVYRKYQELLVPKFGIIIISTPEGIMTTKEARKRKIGGELICEVR